MFRLVETGPVKTSGLFDLLGYMSLSVSADWDLWQQEDGKIAPFYRGSSWAYSRQIPENVIVRHRCILDPLPRVTNAQVILSPQTHPLTAAGAQAIGYEDPTVVSAGLNPFEPGVEGILCTQTYSAPKNPNKLWTNLVYFNPSSQKLMTVLTGESAQELGIKSFVDMVKEAEIIVDESGSWLLFEYGDGFSSNLGSAYLKDGKVDFCMSFHTARDDGSEHVSTCGGRINLDQDRRVYFYNRCRDSEWGIAYALADNRSSKRWEISPNWVIRAPKDRGLGPDGRLIAFGSGVYQNPNDLKQLIVLYHVNDNSCWYAVLEITG